jgi:hypothetical protein
VGRHKETYTAEVSTSREPSIDGLGKIVIPLEIQSGDVGRQVKLILTMQKLESLVKTAQQAMERNRIDQLQQDFKKREWELQVELWHRDTCIKELDQAKKKLEGVIERVNDILHPGRSDVAVESEVPDVSTTTWNAH